jgi:outer membrane protein
MVFSDLGVSSLKKNFAVFPALVLGVAALAHAQTPTKVAIIHVQNAILQTKDGQKAAADLQAQFAPKEAELSKKQSDIAALQDQLKKAGPTMSEDVKAKLMRDIDSSTTKFNRDTQDARADLDEAQGKLMQELGNKVMDVIIKYATQNGFAVVLDVSNPQTPVLWASETIDITSEIVKLYDAAHPGTGAPATAPVRSAVPPATKQGTQTSPTMTRPPAAPPVTKKN